MLLKVSSRGAAGGGANLRAWSPADGALLWEHVLPTGRSSGSGGGGGVGVGAAAGDKVFSHEAAMAAIAAARAAEASSDDPAVTEAAAKAAVDFAAKGLAGTTGGGGCGVDASEGGSSMVVLAAGEGRTAPLLVVFMHGRVFVRHPRPSLSWRGSM